LEEITTVNDELPRLDIWQRLTGKLLLQASPNPHKLEWHELPESQQAVLNTAAKFLNQQLCLCWKCGERAPLIAEKLCCEQCRPRVLTQAEYARVLNEQDYDFCDCCGGKYKIAGLHEVQMPDLDQPEQSEGGTHYPLIGGFHACYGCFNHCENGPCEPGNLVAILENPAGQEEQQPYYTLTWGADGYCMCSMIESLVELIRDHVPIGARFNVVRKLDDSELGKGEYIRSASDMIRRISESGNIEDLGVKWSEQND
jgi:hypothetical protein